MFLRRIIQGFCILELTLKSVVYGRAVFIPNFLLEKCTEFKGNEANVVDTSEVDTHIENDTHVYFIGTVKFKSGFTAAPYRFYTEKYERGQWIIQVFDRKFDDFCKTTHDKADIVYPKMDSFPACPIEAGTTWDLNMIPFNLPEHVLDTVPPHYYGKWRGTILMEFIIDGEKKLDCRRAHGDIFEDGKPKVLGKIVGK